MYSSLLRLQGLAGRYICSYLIDIVLAEVKCATHARRCFMLRSIAKLSKNYHFCLCEICVSKSWQSQCLNFTAFSETNQRLAVVYHQNEVLHIIRNLLRYLIKPQEDAPSAMIYTLKRDDMPSLRLG